MSKKRLFFVIIVFFTSSFLFTQQSLLQVDFYGAVSNAEDTNTLHLTEDLFFTQLVSTHRFSITDLRNTIFTTNLLDSPFTSEYVFYMDISQKDSQWTCGLHLINKNTKQDISISREYLGYYKILMEAKTSVAALLSKFDTGLDSGINVLSDKTPSSVDKQEITLETIAGTWNGEENIDKIILMKAGRGFIIYKNGASMSVNISINNDIITIEQVAKSNASFYPDLPREIALISATKDNKISWIFSMIGNNKMQGIKHTLVPVIEDKKIVSAEQGTIEVTWVR
jgi:hypothetical protein